MEDFTLHLTISELMQIVNELKSPRTRVSVFDRSSWGDGVTALAQAIVDFRREKWEGVSVGKVIIDDVPRTETFDDMGEVTVTHFAITGMPQEDLPEALRGMVPIKTGACRFCGMPLGRDGFCTETHPPESQGSR